MITMADVCRVIPRRVRQLLRRWQGVGVETVESLFLERLIARLFFARLIRKTSNFADVKWLGKPVWQNVLDLWVIQETIVEIGPALLIESGTNRGGSAYFYASLFDLMGAGDVLTFDVRRMHDLSHPRIEFAIGSSLEPQMMQKAKRRAELVKGPVMVILDSDHSEEHVFQEMEAYAPLVSPASFMLVQDGVIDTLGMLRGDRPGPLPAIRRFLNRHPEFEVDEGRGNRFLITHHPLGWLRRTR